MPYKILELILIIAASFISRCAHENKKGYPIRAPISHSHMQKYNQNAR